MTGNPCPEFAQSMTGKPSPEISRSMTDKPRPGLARSMTGKPTHLQGLSNVCVSTYNGHYLQEIQFCSQYRARKYEFK
jgi:hypothetical protein